MPRYRFSVWDNDNIDDENGVILSDDLAARAYAIQIIHELQKGDEATWSGYSMRVMRDGRLLWKYRSSIV